MFVQRSFGPNKPVGGTDPLATLQGVRIENYFAPKDDVAGKITGRLDQAQQSIHFMAFSFTSDSIGSAIHARAKAGISVAGVFEKTGSETQFSEYGKLLKAGLDVLQDGNPYVMHHKVIIIDGRTVIFGSYNFSNNADKDNDENLLIIDDPALAQAFEAEFQRVREVALNPLKK
jgi:phosphatidylserine/phosphatidylglycerophosphate/cardiolipin synthase-like enzyme